VKPPDLQQLLIEFTADRLALLQRHEAGARVVAHYDFNNTYQYVIAREETHVGWLLNALADCDAGPPKATETLAVPSIVTSRTASPDVYRLILEDDAKQLGSFVERWRPRVAAMTHARHRTMLDVVLGESLEHQRLFAQAGTGLENVLGRRTTESPRTGSVLPTRWVE